jgi:hypothetical protein
MTAQEYIETKIPNIISLIRKLLERNQEKLDANGYIQFENSIQISPENRRIPVQFEWIDGIQLVRSGEIVSIIVWVSTKESEDITGFLLREFPDEDQVEILNQLLEVFEL